jgi:hypothetical protein
MPACRCCTTGAPHTVALLQHTAAQAACHVAWRHLRDLCALAAAVESPAVVAALQRAIRLNPALTQRRQPVRSSTRQHSSTSGWSTTVALIVFATPRCQ